MYEGYVGCDRSQGNGSCPLFSWTKDHKKLALKSNEARWETHLWAFPEGCGSFQPGDRRVREPVVAAEALF